MMSKKIFLLMAFIMINAVGCFGGKDAPAPAVPTLPPAIVDEDGDVLSQLKIGYLMPDNVQVIPADNNAQAQGLSARVHALLSDPNSDYQKEQYEREIEEQSLDQFEIIDEILDAFKQTAYNDPAVINQAPYTAIISWQEDNRTEIEQWVVKSKMIVENGKDVNKVMAWIQEEDDGHGGGPEIIKVEFKIFEEPTTANPYGEWQLYAAFFNAETGLQEGNFLASASPLPSGETQIQIGMRSEEEGPDGQFTHEEKGRLVVSESNGRGVVLYPDYDRDQNGNETQEMVEAKYAYNPLRVHIDSDEEISCKSRTNFYDVDFDYGVYDLDGNNMRKMKDFGFSVRYTDPATERSRYLYYSAWKGRHNLWGLNPGETLPVGTELVKKEHGQPEETFRVGENSFFEGYLIKKNLVAADMDDIKNSTLEMWDGTSVQLRYNQDDWFRCQNECQQVSQNAYNLNNLTNDRSIKKEVYIHSNVGELKLNDQNSAFVLMDGSTVDQEDIDRVWIWISQPVFLEYTDNGWISYDGSFSENNHRPQIDRNSAEAYEFPEDRTFNLWGNGEAYNITVTDTGTQDVAYVLEKEVEDVVQPNDESTALANTQFTDHDNNTYTWDAQNHILLDSRGEIVTDDRWSIFSGNQRFSWVYDNGEEDWKKATYLEKGDGSYAFLEDPIQFKPFSVNGRDIRGLGYQGHLFGIYHIWDDLRRNDGIMTQDMKDKVVNIPDMPLEALDGTVYRIKPLRGMRVLDLVDVTECSDLPLDNSINLDNFPDYQTPNMGDVPADAPVRAVQGVIL